MKEKIIEILQEIRPEFTFSENQNFIEEGMLDSFDVINLVQTLDERFSISIDGTDVLPQNFSTLTSIENLLRRNGVK